MPTRLSRYAEALMEAAWLAAIILVPVFFDIYSSRIFEPDKITLLRSLALLILGAWVVKLVEEGLPRPPEKDAHGLNALGAWFRHLVRIPLLPQAMLVAAVYLISTIFSVSPATSLWGSYQRLQGTYTTLSYLVIFAAMVATLRRREQIDRLVTSLILCSLPIAFYGFLQRYQIDPIPWGGNTTVRIAANLGNSIFVAAYLVMVWPLTLGRVIASFRDILQAEDRLPLHITRATLYLTLAMLQPIALYFSFSRGPALGFGASALFMGLLAIMLLIKRRRLRVSLMSTIIVLGLLAAGALIVFNIPNGPLQSLRSLPGIGRFGQILDPQSNNALVRKYIWQGAADLVAPHAPIQFPDGSGDRFNFLRPLIGYGPESMYVAYNPFYVPDLGHVEKRNASPDRSHNETWDALVITGALGFITYLVVFMSVFYYGLKWLGMVESRAQKILFWSATLGGGAVGAALTIAWGGIEWFGVGLPFGIAVGLAFIYLPLTAFTHYRSPETPAAATRALTIIMLLAAVLAHFLEINFGIAIAATRTFFWVFSALLLLVGHILPQHGVFVDSTPAPAAEAQVKKTETAAPVSSSRSSRRRKVEKSARQSIFGKAAWLSEALIYGMLLIVLMSALGYNYVSNTNRNTTTGAVLRDSLTVLPNRNDAASYGIFALVAITFLVGALLFSTENQAVKDFPSWLRGLGAILGVEFAGALFYWVLQAGNLASLAGFTPSTADQLIVQVDRIGSLLTNFYIWLFLILLVMAYLFSRELPARNRSGGAGWAAAAGALLLVAVLVVRTNLRIIHADITFKMAEPFAKETTWNLASLLYLHAIEQAPDEDYYYLFLGRSYLEQAKTLENESDKATLVNRAESDLKVAQRINPLNTDHTANLARLYSWWASQATDADQRQQRGETSNKYYERALALSPQNSTLWGEWAILLLDLLNEPQQAYIKLEKALSLDTEYNFTQGLMGDYYMAISRQTEDQAERTANLEKAIEYYDTAIALSKGTASSNLVQYQFSKGNAIIEIASLTTPPDPQRLKEAAIVFEMALQSGPRTDDVWRIYEQIARLYVQLMDKASALAAAEQALKAAPDTQKERLNQFIQQIQQLP